MPCLRAVHPVQTRTTAGATVVITIAPTSVSMVSKDQLLLLDRQSRRPESAHVDPIHLQLFEDMVQ